MQRKESSFTGVGGVRIVYDVWTPEREPAGVLVLLHGAGEHARRYDHVIERLGELGLVVYAPDHRGHGRSGGKRVHLREFSEYTDDVHQLFGIITAEHHGADRFLLGHSMGGTIALAYALEHQDELTALALSGPALLVTHGKPRLVVELGKLVGRIAPDVPIESLDTSAISRDPNVVAAYNSDPLVHHGRLPAGIARGIVTTADSFPPRLPSLTVPVLLQHGGADRIADVGGSRLVAARAGSPDLTLKVYDGLYHEVFNEPERRQVLDDLVAWLRPRVRGA